MMWIAIAYLVVAFAMLGAVYCMEVIDGEDAEPMVWPVRILIALAWPLFAIFFVVEIVRGAPKN